MCVWLLVFVVVSSSLYHCVLFRFVLLSLYIGFVPFQLFSSSSHILLFKCVLIHRSGTDREKSLLLPPLLLLVAIVAVAIVDASRSKRKESKHTDCVYRTAKLTWAISAGFDGFMWIEWILVKCKRYASHSHVYVSYDKAEKKHTNMYRNARARARVTERNENVKRSERNKFSVQCIFVILDDTAANALPYDFFFVSLFMSIVRLVWPVSLNVSFFFRRRTHRYICINVCFSAWLHFTVKPNINYTQLYTIQILLVKCVVYDIWIYISYTLHVFAIRYSRGRLCNTFCQKTNKIYTKKAQCFIERAKKTTHLICMLIFARSLFFLGVCVSLSVSHYLFSFAFLTSKLVISYYFINFERAMKKKKEVMIFLMIFGALLIVNASIVFFFSSSSSASFHLLDKLSTN